MNRCQKKILFHVIFLTKKFVSVLFGFHFDVYILEGLTESLDKKVSFFQAVSAQFSSVQYLSRVRLFVSPWTAARWPSLSFTISQCLLDSLETNSIASTLSLTFDLVITNVTLGLETDKHTGDF